MADRRMGANLKEFRIRRGHTIEAAADAAGIPVMALIAIESGSRNPGAGELVALTGAYGIGLDRPFADMDAVHPIVSASPQLLASFEARTGRGTPTDAERRDTAKAEWIDRLATCLGCDADGRSTIYALPHPRRPALPATAGRDSVDALLVGLAADAVLHRRFADGTATAAFALTLGSAGRAFENLCSRLSTMN